MIKIHLCRHGQASFDAPSDGLRPLTEAGLRATQALLQVHSAKFSGVQALWHSPLLRAKQTASIFNEALALDMQEKHFLTPDSPPELMIEALDAGTHEHSEVLLVAHQPLLGNVASILCNGTILQAYPFATSEVLTLECELVAPGCACIAQICRP